MNVCIILCFELVDKIWAEERIILLKIRKALEIYVSLRGYKQGGNGSNQYKQKDHNGLFAKATLDEIAKELNMSTTNLKRALRIERNLTDLMKELRVYYVLIITYVKDFRGNLGR